MVFSSNGSEKIFSVSNLSNSLLRIKLPEKTSSLSSSCLLILKTSLTKSISGVITLYFPL